VHLREFYDYKNQLMQDLLTNERIVELLGETEDISDPESLAYTQVFPCEYVPDTVENGKTFICFDVDIQRSVDKTFLSPTLYIWVFTHRSQLRLPEGGLRTDEICSEICKAINGSRSYGLGELRLFSAKRFAPMTDFQGKVLTFYAKDFSRVHDGKKPIPSSRKFE